MSELSIFIDESGDFGEVKEIPAYYLVTMVFHDQAIDISKEIDKLEESMRTSGFDLEYIHTGPVIRREQVFANYSLEGRRKLLYKMLYFYNKCSIHHDTVIVNRKEALDKITLSGRLSKEIAKMIAKHATYFEQFDKIIVYYDNGQAELSAVLNAVLSLLFNDVEFRRAEPQKYRLLQVADFVCSMELLKIKREEKRLSKSEDKFFYKPQELQKPFLRSIEEKRLKY
ncbi:MAG: DUF3800 domain-containing protein [Lachnospiraceae bacterium]|nr:DUF3800 domain-containing protein [Lachnospiraceae bacterium]